MTYSIFFIKCLSTFIVLGIIIFGFCIVLLLLTRLEIDFLPLVK